MRSGQATGWFTSIPLLLFIGVALLFHIHLHWILWLVIGVTLTQTLGLAFQGDDETNEPEWKSDRDDLWGAIVSEINGHTVMVTHGRRRFIVSKEQDGTPFCQEVNVRNNTLGKKVYGLNRQGLSADDVVADYIKRKINTGG